jgi:hypothetical protein
LGSLTALARSGRAQLLFARIFPVRFPPTLVLGMPRSGTTWVGRTLGDAPRALYFNEPVSEVHVAEQGRATFFEVDPDNPPASYVWPARFAAAGLPAFGPRTLGEDRRPRRIGAPVVIKEVNPLAIDWYLRALRPRLVYLVRHPAAVAASLAGRGWDFPVYEQRFLTATQATLPTNVPDSYWGRIGAVQGVALAMAERAIAIRPRRSRILAYEDLCRDPEARFKDLYDFCRLTWNDRVAAVVLERTQGEVTRGADDPAGTVRDTAAMADAWRSEITAEQLADVRAGWMATNPSRYTSDEEWAL